MYILDLTKPELTRLDFVKIISMTAAHLGLSQADCGVMI